MRLSLLTFHRVITQPAMISKQNIWASPRMLPWQWKSPPNNLSLQRSKWSIVQHHHTFPTTGKSTIMYNCSICKKNSTYLFKMLTANMESIRYKFTYPDSTGCLDSYNTTYSSSDHYDINMSSERYGDHHTIEPVHILKLHMACSATSFNFYLLPRYETPAWDVNISLNMANLYMINISAQDFHIWKHHGNNRSDVQLQHLATIPLIPAHKIYQHLLNNTLPIMPFNMDKESTEHTNSIWTLFSHPGMYATAIGLLMPVGLGLVCCYFFLVTTCQISILTFTTR